MFMDILSTLTLVFFALLAVAVTVALIVGPPKNWARNNPATNATVEEAPHAE